MGKVLSTIIATAIAIIAIVLAFLLMDKPKHDDKGLD